MTRLTKYDRESITDKLLRHRFGEAIDRLHKDFADLALDAYRAVYDGPTRIKMDALPAGWLLDASCVSVTFGTSYERLWFNGRVNHYISAYAKTPLGEARMRVPSKDDSRCLERFEADSPLCVRYFEAENKRKDIVRDMSEARAQIEVALRKVTTVKALLRDWPDVEPFLGCLADKPASLPAIPAKKLNKMLGLPVE